MSVDAVAQIPSLLHLVLLLTAAYIVLRAVSTVVSLASRWIPVGLGTAHVPTAPGSNWVLGHVFQLASGCAWEKMYDWVASRPPLVKFRILHRTGVIVGDPRGLKRIFQASFVCFSFGPCSFY